MKREMLAEKKEGGNEYALKHVRTGSILVLNNEFKILRGHAAPLRSVCVPHRVVFSGERRDVVELVDMAVRRSTSESNELE